MTTTYVPVQVPEDQLTSVYALLSAGAVPEPEPPIAGGPEWDRELVTDHLVNAGSDSIKQLARYLADRPDEDVTTDEAAAALGLPHGWNSIAGALGAYGRYLSNRGLGFPWESLRSNAASGWRSRLRMDADLAALVRDLL